MKFTAGLISLDTVSNEILSRVAPLIAQKTLSLVRRFGRILASDVVSLLDVPGFDNLAMDGYVVCLADIVSGQPLSVTSKSFAGQSYHSEWSAGTCTHIMTSALVLEDCEAVVVQEQAKQTDNGVCFTAEVHNGQNTCRHGEDVFAGAVVFPAGTRPTTTELPVIVSLGIAEVPVIRKVRVALFSAGDELQLLGQPLSDGQIYDTNRPAMHLMLRQLGCEVINLGITHDDPHALRAAFIEADSQADVVIGSGGVSVSETDYTKATLEELGKIIFWKLAIKPGKPFAFDKFSNSWFCGLPGNPASATLTFYRLVQLLLAKLGDNTASDLPVRQCIRTTSRLKKMPGCLDFQRGVLQRDADDELEMTATGHQGSHMFGSFNLDNRFVMLEHDRGNVEVGEWAEVESLSVLFEGL